jgi:nitrogen fixation/metabolism regulation signal transduction histidine kinase
MKLPSLKSTQARMALLIGAQINQPLDQLARAAKSVIDGNFETSELVKISARSDEVGSMAGEFIAMAGAVEQRAAQLNEEAEAIRAKIR